MPAIQLNRLNAEVQYLARQFGDQERFSAGLHELFDRYAAWSFRRGEVTHRQIQIPQYHLPDIVMQKALQSVRLQCLAAPEHAGALAEKLWGGGYLEIRQFAIAILTMLPLEDPQMFMDVILRWLTTANETYLIDALLVTGCSRLRSEFPDFWMLQLERWLDSESLKEETIGLKALTVSVGDPKFRHIPNLYRLSTQLVLSAPTHHLAALQELVEAMIRREPAETSFFLQQILLRGAAKETARIVRRKLSLLPKENQAALREVLADLRAPEGNE